MRLKEDSSSWRSGGVKRRDYRHDLSTPEVPQGHPKRKQKTAKPKTPKHEHVWVKEDTREWLEDYYRREYGHPAPPSRSVTYKCSKCGKTKSQMNMRYAYEYWKWSKKYRDRYFVFRRDT